MPSTSSELTELGVRELADLTRKRVVAAEEVVRSHLARIEALDGGLGAFVYVDAEGSLAEARRVDAASARGRTPGPLHGVPIGVKDVFDVAGMPTTGGSRLPATHPRRDSDVAGTLRAAGAILIGKLTTSEYSCGSPYLLRRPRNPWQRDHVPGGSSAGAGIAVSASMLPGAVGGDTGGSVRIPASFCGVFGLRPTAGIVRTDGAIPLAPGIDIPGPLARTARDADALLEVMAGGHALSMSSSTSGVWLVGGAADDDVDPEIGGVVERVARETAQLLGMRLQIASAEPLRRGWAGAWAMIYSRALRVHLQTLRRELARLSPTLVWKLCAALALTDDDLRTARLVVAGAVEALHEMVGNGSLVVMPTMARVANRADARYGGDTMTWTAAASMAGLPAVTVPADLSIGGLPIGVQMVSAATTDRGLLAVAAQLEDAGLVGYLGEPFDVDGRPGQISVTPLEEPPPFPITDVQVEEVRRAAQRAGLVALDERAATGAAQSLVAVRSVLY